jgi:hypothetical protein
MSENQLGYEIEIGLKPELANELDVVATGRLVSARLLWVLTRAVGAVQRHPFRTLLAVLLVALLTVVAGESTPLGTSVAGRSGRPITPHWGVIAPRSHTSSGKRAVNHAHVGSW